MTKIASYLPHAIVCALVQDIVTIMKHMLAALALQKNNNVDANG